MAGWNRERLETSCPMSKDFSVHAERSPILVPLMLTRLHFPFCTHTGTYVHTERYTYIHPCTHTQANIQSRTYEQHSAKKNKQHPASCTHASIPNLNK